MAEGYAVPEVVPPLAAYAPAVQSGQWVFTAGQLPFVNGELLMTGKVGTDVEPASAAQAARMCALNGLGAVKSVVGDLDRVARIVKITVFVASAPDFTGQPAVANGASELMGMAFGDAGVHARSAVGVASLPLDAPVEVELIVEILD